MRATCRLLPYYLMERNRPDWCGYLHRAGALFQEWIVVQWAKVEQQKLCWIQSVPLFVNVSGARNETDPTQRPKQGNVQFHSVMTPEQLRPPQSFLPLRHATIVWTGQGASFFFRRSCVVPHFYQTPLKYQKKEVRGRHTRTHCGPRCTAPCAPSYRTRIP